MALKSILIAPIIEEVLYRGYIQEEIGQMQTVTEDLRRGNRTIEELRRQDRTHRVRITGLLFGLAHISNPGPLIGKVIQASWCTFGGIGLGYLKEKRGSIALPIYSHAINNALVKAVEADKINPLIGLASLIALDVCNVYS